MRGPVFLALLLAASAATPAHADVGTGNPFGLSYGRAGVLRHVLRPVLTEDPSEVEAGRSYDLTIETYLKVGGHRVARLPDRTGHAGPRWHEVPIAVGATARRAVRATAARGGNRHVTVTNVFRARIPDSGSSETLVRSQDAQLTIPRTDVPDPAPCAAHDARTVAMHATARAFTAFSADDGYRILYGCDTRFGRLAVLSDAPRDPDPGDPDQFVVRNVRLAGGLAALETQGDTREGVTHEISVLDLRTGQTIAVSATGPLTPGQASPPGRYEFDTGLGPTTDLVLSPSGAIAWIVCDEHTPGDRLQVRAAPAPPAGGVRSADPGGGILLDDGAGIEPRSLTLDGTTVHWRDDGPRYAPLPG